MTASAVNVKAAIVKYLLGDWTKDEQERLKQIRHDLASKTVPEVLSFSNAPVAPTTIDDYVTLLTEEPKSEKGQRATTYLAKLQQGKPGIKTYVNDIDDSAKLAYLNAEFLSGKGDNTRGLTYTQDGIKVEFREGEIEINGNFSWQTVSRLVPDSKNFVYWKPPLGFGLSQLREESRVEVRSGSRVDEIIQAATNAYKEDLARRIADAITKTGEEGTIYEILFPEGKIKNGTVTLTKYSPRVPTILNALLTIQ